MIANVCAALLLSLADGDLPLRLADQQPPPPPPPPPPQEPADTGRRDRRSDRDDAGSLFTVSASGRAAFPFGSVRDNTSGNGHRLAYDDLFDIGGGADAELSFLMVDWGGEGRRSEHHSLGFYLSAQYDHFNGNSASLSGGGTIQPGEMTVISGFAGFKHHVPWGGALYHEFRVGGGFIHYSNVDATVNGAGVRLFSESWGVAAEASLKLGVDFGRLSVFVAGSGRAGEGPQEGAGLPFPSTSSTFFTAAAEAGLELKF